MKEITCPISSATKIVGDFWSILILRALLSGEKRFSDLESEVDTITSSTLSTKLKNLEKEGIIKREQFSCIPPKVIYSLTDKGSDLEKMIREIERFGTKWYKKD